MQITSELNLLNFKFWSGAKDHNFSYSELSDIQNILEDVFFEGTTETKINDLFWFEVDFLCECIGLKVEDYDLR
tara:strand:+ start:1377 stop:1598 length:222 start_codon:yes stop_codon:yes gene_type:complete